MLRAPAVENPLTNDQFARFLHLTPLILVPAVIAVAFVEGVVLSFWMRRAYNWRASFASLADVLGRNYIVYRYLPFTIAAPAIGWAWTHCVTTLPVNTVAAFGLLFIGEEFFYYWFHRASHRMRWFWVTHVVHHSSNELNLSAAYRFGWTAGLTGSAIFYAPLVWLGFPPVAVFAMVQVNVLYQFWVHAAWIPKLGWLEYVLNTPSHHRVHHAANAEYLDANYGGVLIVFDRLFGTFIAEREDRPCRYGLVKPLTSNNPLVINFHEWSALGRDLRHARSWRERARYLFAPPGWRPNGEGWTTEDLRRVALPATSGSS
jgi:sterol desaturase/sphingolipid hydroxylase (fatty acid hydroxylase superfamily)